MGGCAHGRRPAVAVADSLGRHHHLANLSIHDGSLFPTSIGANRSSRSTVLPRNWPARWPNAWPGPEPPPRARPRAAAAGRRHQTYGLKADGPCVLAARASLRYHPISLTKPCQDVAMT
ncbi:GMC oxidoreductase [Pseudomonas aeruginosa]|uniref:GMC oxidoreductase n=1 Tax=Pseudomonas aeruginosa TaxID=287 RepID=UPI0039AFB88E